MFTASALTDNSLRDLFIESVHSRAGENSLGGVFPASYDTKNGMGYGGEASPALGAIFAPMALK